MESNREDSRFWEDTPWDSREEFERALEKFKPPTAKDLPTAK